MCVRARMGYLEKIRRTVGNRITAGFLRLKVCLNVCLTVGIMPLSPHA